MTPRQLLDAALAVLDSLPDDDAGRGARRAAAELRHYRTTGNPMPVQVSSYCRRLVRWRSPRPTPRGTS